VSQAVGRQAASANDNEAGFGTTLRRGTATRSAIAPWWRSESSDRFGSNVSSPIHDGSLITPCTTTSLPSSSSPAASVPRIIGSCSCLSPTPRSENRSWWLSDAAFTSMVVQPSGTSGSGRSPTTNPESGSSELKDSAYTANMWTTLGRLDRLAA
jgi:hypothetical protein